MITDAEARKFAARIRRGTDTASDRVAYDKWSRAGKGRRPRTTLGELEKARRKQQANTDLMAKERELLERQVETKRAYEAGKARAAEPPSELHEQATRADPAPDPIAPPLPLEGEIVDPIAPPIDLPDPDGPEGFDIGGGVAHTARMALEALDAENPSLGGVSLARIFGANFWNAYEAAATRMIEKHVGALTLADDELVIASTLAVVGQPIAIPVIKENGAAWLEQLKRKFGFGAKATP